MELGIMERIQLLNILPAEGNVVTLRIVQKLRTELGFTETEIKEHEIKTENDQVKWKTADYKVDISIGEKAMDIIKEAFRKLDREGKMQASILPLYDTFMEVT